jgi:hypothetical protein
MSEKQVQGLSLLLSLQHELQKLTSLKEFSFFVVNQTYHLIPYEAAFFWRKTLSGQIEIVSASGVVHLGENSPFSQRLVEFVKSQLTLELVNHLHVVGDQAAVKQLLLDDEKHSQKHVLWAPLYKAPDDLEAGLIFVKQQLWVESEEKQLQWLMDAYTYSWLFLTNSHRRGLGKLKEILGYKKWVWGIVIVLFLISLFPVRLTAIAPAEVVAKSSKVATAPYDGVIKAIKVKPNAKVEKGQVLFVMEDRALEGSYHLAQQAYYVAKEQYQRAIQKGFTNSESRSEVAVLRSTVAEKKASVVYAKALLDRSLVKAKQSGIAIFASANKWVGKPVVTGERVMQVAQPNHVELEIWLPVADAIQFDLGSKVKMYLSSSPLKTLKGSLTYQGFNATVTPGNILSYRLVADLDGSQVMPRIGLQGSAKIYGSHTVLIYYLLRRPLSALRQWVGL